MKGELADFSKIVNEQSDSYSIADDSISPFQKAAHELDLSDFPASPRGELPVLKSPMLMSPRVENSAIGDLINSSNLTIGQSERKLPFVVNNQNNESKL